MSSPDLPQFIDLHPSANPVSAEKRQALLSNLTFGSVFTDHMITMRWKDGDWQRGELVPFGPLSLSPASSVLHYGQAIFEGFKAYLHEDGSIFSFRPEMNARRFAASARRLAMPELPVERFIEAAEVLVRQDRAWVPSAPGTSLYIRPLLIANESTLGVRPASDYLMVMFASPVGAYFKGGMAPVDVWVSADHVRAAPHGTGAAKCAGNYAASLQAQAHARTQGCEQVLYLDALQHRFIEELGGMNFFMVLDAGAQPLLVTPDLSSGTLLAGVTRDSVLRLAPDMGYRVEERPVAIDEFREAARSGTLREAFACGTAAIITSIGTLRSTSDAIVVGGGKTGPIAEALRNELLAIQYGRRPDPYGWMHRIC